jgi:ABC-type Fe3+-siderophore transport system permease subunit
MTTIESGRRRIARYAGAALHLCGAIALGLTAHFLAKTWCLGNECGEAPELEFHGAAALACVGAAASLASTVFALTLKEKSRWYVRLVGWAWCVLAVLSIWQDRGTSKVADAVPLIIGAGSLVASRLQR